MIRTYNKGEGVKFNELYTSSDFDCKCQDCKHTVVDSDLVDKLYVMSMDIGGKLTVTSGYRCPEYQKQLKLRGYDTAAGVSQHQLGRAADIVKEPIPGYELEGFANRAGFKAIGIGRSFIHVDLRSDIGRRWKYTY